MKLWPASPPKVGESHRVEVIEALSVGDDSIVEFADLDRPHRRYRESYSLSESSALKVGDRGAITLRPSRVVPEGRWAFERD